MEKTKVTKSRLIRTMKCSHGKGEFSLNRELIRFSYVCPSNFFTGKKDGMAYYINKKWLNKRIDYLENKHKNKIENSFLAEALNLRKNSEGNITYIRVRNSLWELFSKFDLNNKKEITLLKNYIFYHFIQTVTGEYEALYAAYVVFTDWNKKIGLELFFSIYAIHSLNWDMYQTKFTNIH